ncbi:MAG: heavy metal translocating P-type ATPase [Clostridia bacterium]|nr:heavy metal translocating P-type ATPase [Clostridia bacterium]
MEQYNVTGMTCAACSARVEKAVSSLEGVESCSVNLLMNSMTVEGSVTAEAVISAVEKAGYGASLKNGNNIKKEEGSALKDTETPELVRRLVASLGFLLVLMYFSMGQMISLPLPPFFDGNPIAIALVQMLLSLAVMIINKKFFINGAKGIIHRSPNMDTLVSLGSSAAFVYSTAMTFAMTASTHPEHYLHELYFESAAMILALITVGKMLEAHSKGKTTNALKSLMDLSPKTATLLRDGKEVVVPIEAVKKGDVFIVKTGETIPTDAVVLEGSASVNESSLTGESLPVEKEVGSSVYAATLNTSGYIKCEATRVGEDTSLSAIIKMVSDAAATKAPISKVADKVSGVFVPIVISIAIVTFIVWMLLDKPLGFSLARAISVLVISCPCALGLATPVAIMVGSGVGAKNGILFKTAASLEAAGKTEIVVLDKTGTITTGEPTVTDVIASGEATETELLEKAFSLEEKSEHPLAKAIVKYAKEKNIIPKPTTDFKTLAGNGVSAILNGKELIGGSRNFINNIIKLEDDVIKTWEKLAEDGKTPLLFCENGTLLGMIAVSDELKSDSVEAVRQMKKMGLRVVMLTGDNERTAKAIAKRAEIDEVVAGVLPSGKEAVLKKLNGEGKTAMVGDGINDAPALTRANIGVAIGAGTDVAIDAADVVLMKNTLIDVPAALRLSKATLRNIHENLFWAFIYNTIGIPLAAGAFIELLGWEMNPMLGALAMSLSSFCVVTNALRLNLFKIYNDKHDKPKKHKTKGTKNMEKTMVIEGMMCMHCSGRVKKTLEALDGVASADVSHEKGTAVVTLSKDIPNDTLKTAVEEQGYKVISVK